jgi:CHAT domain-containing protein
MKWADQARAREEQASAWNNQGIVYRREGKLARSVECFNEALKIDRAMGSRWGMGYDERNLGMAFRLMGRLEDSETHIQRGAELSRSIGDEINLAKSLYALGDTQFELKKLAEAEAAYQEAARLAEKHLLRDVQWRALHGLGRIAAARDRKDRAVEFLKRAVDVVEAMRQEIKIEEFRNSFLSNKSDLYEDIVTYLADEGKADEALVYSERARARNFIDIFSSRQFALRSEEDRKLFNRQQELLIRMREVREQLAAETEAEKAKALSARLEELKKSYEDLLLDIKVRNPGLSSFVEVDVLSVPELQELFGPDAALAVLFTTEREFFVWLVHGGKTRLFRFETRRTELEKLIRRYRVMIQNRENLDEVRTLSKRIYALGLDRVLAAIPAEVRYLGIVPHGPFHYASFASFYGYGERGDKYVVERFSLFYGPSASIFKRVLSAPPPERKLELNILAVGDPAVGNAAFDLPFALKEVHSIQRDFIHVTVLTGKEATETWVKNNIGRFQVVHFASHGEFDSIAPLFSALKLAPGADSDGNLEVHEVTGIRLKAVLVTLSACQSGLGKLSSGDELVSLARAFVYAGTQSILSTLWRVDDVATALVVKHFYRNYVTRGAADSLREAQIRVLNDQRHAHPSYWAGMTLTGDYR